MGKKTDPKTALPYFQPPFPFEQVEIACALYDAIRKRAPNGEYVAVRIEGASGWTIVDPRSQEAMLAALETIEPKP